MRSIKVVVWLFVATPNERAVPSLQNEYTLLAVLGVVSFLFLYIATLYIDRQQRQSKQEHKRWTMSFSHPSSNSLRLSDQRWYQVSSNSMSMYMNDTGSNRNVAGSKVNDKELATKYRTYGTIPIDEAKSNDKNPNSRKPSTITGTNSEVERMLPDLLVMEIRRDGNNVVTYRHYTIRGLYRYVLDAIADRTGVLQAAAYYQLWQKKTITSNIKEAAPPNNNGTEMSSVIPSSATNPSTVDTPSSATAFLAPSVLPQETVTGGQDPLSNSSDAAGIMHTTDHTQGPPKPAPQPVDLGVTGSIPHNAHAHLQGSSGNNKNVTYRERLGGYLHPRDMRRLVTPFSTSNEPEIIVRRHVILINYDPLRTIILRDRLLVLVPDGADTLLSKLETRIRGYRSREDMENAIFGTNTDQNDSTNHSTIEATPVKSPPASTTKNTASRSGKSTTDRTLLNKKSTSNSSNESKNDGTETKTVTTDHCCDDNDDDDDNATNLDEWNEMAAREWSNLPFELQCTDAVLYVVGSILQEETIEVQEAAQTFIERIVKHGGAGLEDDPLTIIRVVKDAVQLMSNRVKSYVKSIHRLLDDDEDMALMNLSRLLTHPERFVQPVPQRILNEESDEPELILEANLQIGLTLVNYIEVIQGQIHTAKELIDQRLDATRNKLLFANMLISVFTLCITLGALVGSFFGMNLLLPGNLGEDEFAFNQVVAYTCIGCTVICIGIMLALLYTDTISFRLSGSFRPVRIKV